MGCGEMVRRSWQGCQILAPPALSVPAGKTTYFETCFIRPMSPCKVQMMDVLHYYRLPLKVLGFLSRAPLTFHVTSVHAQQIWRQNCTSDRSDESWLISKCKLYLKENTGILDLLLTVFFPFNFKFCVKTEYFPENDPLVLLLFQTRAVFRAQWCGMALMKFYLLLNRNLIYVKQQF